MRTLFLALGASVALLGAATPVPAPPAATLPAAVAANPVTWQIDPVHSELQFRVRHLVGRVTGTFTDWSGTVTADPADLSTVAVDVTVNTASVHTLNEQRDAHLRTPDFFASDEHPTMTFRSTRTVANGTSVAVYGDLTIRGTTRPVVLHGRYLGRGPDPWGGERVAFEATTTVDRHDFGVSFNQVVEGTNVIGDEVQISIAIEAVRQ